MSSWLQQVALLLCCSLPAGAKEPDWTKLFLVGHRALEAGELTRARQSLEAALASEPEHAATAWGLACVAAREGQIEKALDWLALVEEWGGAERSLLEWDPELRALHGDSRFDALRERWPATEVDQDAPLWPGWEPAWSIHRTSAHSSADQQTLVSESGELFDAVAREIIGYLARPGEFNLNCRVDPNGRFAAVWGRKRGRRGYSTPTVLRIHDAHTGDVRHELNSELSPVGGTISFSESGQALTLLGGPADSSRPRGMRTERWNVGTGVLEESGVYLAPPKEKRAADPEVQGLPQGRSDLRYAAAISPSESTVWLGLESGELCVLDEPTSSRTVVFQAEHGWGHLQLGPEQESLAAFDTAGKLYVFDIKSRELRFTHEPGELPRWMRPACSFSPHGRALVVMDGKGHAALLDAFSGAVLRELQLELNWLFASWSEDSDQLVVAVGPTALLVIDPFGEEEGFEFSVGAKVSSVAHVPGRDQVWVGTQAGEIEVHEAEGGAVLRDFTFAGVDVFGDKIEPWNIAFDAQGERALVASNHIPHVALFEVESGKRSWLWMNPSGNPRPLELALQESKDRLFLWGQGAWVPRVLELSTGRVLQDLSGRGFDEMTPLRSGSTLLAASREGLRWIDLAGGKRRLLRTETGVGHLLVGASGHVDGDSGSLKRLHARLSQRSYPIDALATVLLDPKRVRASRAGVELRAAVVPVPPALDLTRGASRTIRAGAGLDRVVLPFVAVSEDGIRGFEVRIHGETTFQLGEKADGGRKLDLEISRTSSFSTMDVRVRSIGSNGVRSRALYQRIEWQ